MAFLERTEKKAVTAFRFGDALCLLQRFRLTFFFGYTHILFGFVKSEKKKTVSVAFIEKREKRSISLVSLISSMKDRREKAKK